MNSHTRRVALSEPIFDEIYNKIAQHYPNSCIIWIDQVINHTIEGRYNTLKDELNDSTELQLFHGTSRQGVQNIIFSGFDVSFNKVSAYGKGTYFAVDPKLSLLYAPITKQNHDAQFVILCDVLIGKTELGSSNRIPTPDVINFVNRKQDPTIYVACKNDGAIPRYVISFYTGN